MSSDTNKEHGSISSYAVGFILSLLFSFIPYYLVVEKAITGSALYITILAFAMIQMLIQVTFFLHIGRGPKPKWNLFFFAATFGVILMVVGGSVFIIDNLHYNMSPSDKLKKIANDENIYQVGDKLTGACREIYDNHQITITDGQVNPVFVKTSKCDTLTFINNDDQSRKITFGLHPEHGVYAGEEEIVVKNGRSETITLSETGIFNYHDHLQPETAGVFSVNNYDYYDENGEMIPGETEMYNFDDEGLE